MASPCTHPSLKSPTRSVPRCNAQHPKHAMTHLLPRCQQQQQPQQQPQQQQQEDDEADEEEEDAHRNYATATFDLNKRYEKFTTQVGINDDVDSSKLAAKGSALTFKIYVDGELAWQSDTVTKKGQVQDVELNVLAKETLELRTSVEGNNEHVHAVWVDPSLQVRRERRWHVLDNKQRLQGKRATHLLFCLLCVRVLPPPQLCRTWRCDGWNNEADTFVCPINGATRGQVSKQARPASTTPWHRGANLFDVLILCVCTANRGEGSGCGRAGHAPWPGTNLLAVHWRPCHRVHARHEAGARA